MPTFLSDLQEEIVKIVTFDLPYLNMEELFGWLVNVSDDDGIYPGD